LTENKKAIVTKDKDLKDVKVLLNVKQEVEDTMKKVDKITLQIDQLEETIKCF